MKAKKEGELEDEIYEVHESHAKYLPAFWGYVKGVGSHFFFLDFKG